MDKMPFKRKFSRTFPKIKSILDVCDGNQKSSLMRLRCEVPWSNIYSQIIAKLIFENILSVQKEFFELSTDTFFGFYL